MFLNPAGDTVFYKRRIDGLDTLFAFQPDAAGAEVHVRLASSPGQLRAWPTQHGQIIVCNDWPQTSAGLTFHIYDAARVSAALDGRGDVNTKLTDITRLHDFKAERLSLPVEVFERIQGEVICIPGMSNLFGDGQVPAVYEIDGQKATYRVCRLEFLGRTDLPGHINAQPGDDRHWLSVGDSNHMFVIDAKTHDFIGDVIWPVEQQAMARVNFHPRKPEAWVSAYSSLFVFDTNTLDQLHEIPIETELRWHRGERTLGLIGGVCFSADGERALVARPMSGDIAEFDTSSLKLVKTIPTAIDPLELVAAPAVGRIYIQGLRNGNVSWLPYR
ncbi:MAG: YncE family protein [Planctomycetota bacterium]|jgi:hypothetical protein